MKVHPEELESARAYARGLGFEELTPDQMRLIMGRGRDLHKWFKTHPGTHALINVTVIGSILAADWWILTQLPRMLVALLSLVSAAGAAGAGAGAGASPATSASTSSGALLVAAVIVGALHSWLGYSLSIFSLHEGAAHNMIFPGTGRFSRMAAFLARNMCRLASAEPNNYADCHMAHHARFGTEHDPEFLNFVGFRRLWLILLPYGVFINFSDFVIHRPLIYTRQRLFSGLVGAIYNGTYAWLMYQAMGTLFTFVVFVILLPHVGFWTDRVRQFTEHNLMPLENKSGARSFGVGVWGLVVGGGPWGQPCHLAHHLVPSIPWYQQLAMHRYLVSILTDQQRAQFLVRPIIGYPLLVWSIVRDLNAFSRRGTAAQRSYRAG